MTSPYPPGWPDDMGPEAFVKDVVEGLLKKGGDAVEFVKQIVSDTFTGEALNKVAENLNAHSSVNASSQTVYWSTQSIKFDPTILTFAPDAIQISAKGIEILGVNITPGWAAKVEEFILRFIPWNTQLPNQTADGIADIKRNLANTDRRVDAMQGIPATVERHETALRGLTRDQRTLAAGQAASARLSERSVARQAGQADRRAQRTIPFTPQRRSAQAEVAELRQIQNALRDVRTQAQSLTQALA
ncbi:hypothetical protein GTY66_30470 [Streptomyces sp. SID8356]|uniref:hypothetical protein n=1 Tax=unclassified Streptomyces TaxID=2593676 RepID=UPI00036CE121|nr:MULTISPECIES: hypothetical protein [unclassified Streptomyces]MYT40320.1 hypothetical protein [Streptomyces sp. SID8356]